MNPDDPKFTAYALGEFEDLTPAECAEIETLLAGDTHAAIEAQETRALAARLRAEMPGEAAASLHDEQRVAVFEAAMAPAPAAKIVRFPRRATVLAAIAACLVVAVSLAVLFPAIQAEKAAVRKSLAASPPAPNSELSFGDAYSITLQPAIDEEKPQLVVPPVMSLATTNLETSMAFAAATPQGLINPGKEAGKAANRLTLNPRPPPQLGGPLAQYAKASATPVGIPGYAASASDPRGRATAMSRPLTARPGESEELRKTKTEGAEDEVTAQMRLSVHPAPAAPASASAGSTRSMGSKEVRLAGLSGEKEMDLLEKQREPADSRRDSMQLIPAQRQLEPAKTEAFDPIIYNAFLAARENPLSTFSIDVDTASYAIVRRFLTNNQRPPKGAVRIEELLNYFTYDYPQPQGEAPFSATMEVTACPWTPEHRLVRIGLKGREMARDKRPASNLVFLIDVSGSMQPEKKLPLLKQSLALLVDQLGGEDQVAIVVYAGSSGTVLEPTRDKQKMHEALRQLDAGGSTNGASGIQLAYQLAQKGFIKGGTNRVILATDGDWNVGVTNQSDLLDLIKAKAKSGVFLTVLGVGMGNLKDAMLVKLADTGNGNYAYLDTLLEAKKVLVEQLSGTLVTIAKDVKIQVEFNPAQVGAYRLIGYEKRMLAKEDFNDDKKDAGEIGAGHTVTALYEIVPVGTELLALAKPVDALKYQPAPEPAPSASRPANPPPQPERAEPAPRGATPYLLEQKIADAAPRPARKPEAISHEMLTLKLRYKEPEGDTSKLLEFPLTDAGAPWEKSSRDFRFAAAVAGYGMLLRDSPHKGQATWSGVEEWAREGLGADASGYRAEFLTLLEKARALAR